MDKYIKDIIDKLNNASDKYYNTGNSPLSDAEYDKLYDELCEYERQFGIVYSESPTSKVGAPVLANQEKVIIDGKPMLSLSKVHSDDEINDWAGDKEIIGSVKCDGLSCRLTYESGHLVQANTRGDGTTGQAILEHVRQFTNVPLVISKPGKYVIDGEAIIYTHNFDLVNQNGEYKNPRNLAAGSLNLLDMSIVKQRKLSFIAWNVIEGGNFETYTENLKQAEDLGFDVVPHTAERDNYKILEMAQNQGIPTDGVVWRFNNIAYGESLGRTDKFFRAAIAYKFEDERYETEIIDIEWQQGRTGKITPIAIFEEVDTGDSVIARCSLHNLSIMKSLFGTLEPTRGTKMIVVKSNEIIPMCIGTGEVGSGDKIELIKICPICGAELVVQKEYDSEVLFCPNNECNGKLLNKITHYASKTAMDIRGLSKETISKLMDWGWLNSLEDLYKLKEHRTEWIHKIGFGVKSVDNLLNAIEESKTCRLSNFITGLGIPLVGSKVAKEMTKQFSNWEDFIEAIDNDFKWFTIDGFGAEMHKAINKFNYAEAQSIAAEYLTFERAEAETAAQSLNGKTFVITGSVHLYKNRAELSSVIESLGGKVTGSVSSKTDYLINNAIDSTSSKNTKAKSLGIPIISEEEFQSLSGLN